tara:strand:- start:41 stop:322 length:282 start_codon:yes stop_codon:yes gene_type:complete
MRVFIVMLLLKSGYSSDILDEPKTSLLQNGYSPKYNYTATQPIDIPKKPLPKKNEKIGKSRLMFYMKERYPEKYESKNKSLEYPLNEALQDKA